MIPLLTALAVFAGIFTQSITGFGLALVMMPILVSLLGIKTAAPLVAMIAAIAETSLLIQYRKSLNIKAVWRLSIASIVTIPVGVFAVSPALGRARRRCWRGHRRRVVADTAYCSGNAVQGKWPAAAMVAGGGRGHAVSRYLAGTAM